MGRRRNELKNAACLILKLRIIVAVRSEDRFLHANFSASPHFWLVEVESRTQGSRPRTQKQSEAKAKDSLSEYRTFRGQGQECSRPRPRTKNTGASVLQKKSLQKFFSGDLQFIGVPRIFVWVKPST